MRPAIFVPVKGSSERIPSKNTALLDGKPLFLHTLEKLSHLENADIYLDTESIEIAKTAEYIANVKLMKRDASLADNKTDGNKLFMNEVRHCDNNLVVQHLCTSPFITLDTIKKSIAAISNSNPQKEYDSAVLVRKEKLYLWSSNKPVYNISHIPNSKDLPETIIETMGLYAMRREAALCLNRRIGENPLLLEASPLEAIDVNWPEDLALAQLIAAGIREQDQRLYSNIALIMNSALLSDLLDDMGFNNQIIRGLTNVSGEARILGPAKTIRLRRINNGEDFRGIYKALEHYKTLVPGDIIIVENEVNDYAFFGELNANLAIRQGVKGVVVGGMTRDSNAVGRTGLPVFASGTTCQDVRGRAVLESLNKPICIRGVDVHPGDLVFADKEGVVIVPEKATKSVFEVASQRYRNESDILSDIATGASSEELIRTRGEF